MTFPLSRTAPDRHETRVFRGKVRGLIRHGDHDAN